MNTSHDPKPTALRRFYNWMTEDTRTSSRIVRQPGATPTTFGGLPLFEEVPETISVPAREQEPALGGALMASARRLTNRDAKGRNEGAKGGAGKTSPWQEEAWELLDLIGEQRFLANTLAGRMSQASLYVGKIEDSDSPGTRPQHVEDSALQDLLNSIGGGIAGQGQLIHRAGVNLFVAGEVWLVGIPPRLVAGTPEYEAAHSRFDSISPTNRSGPIEEATDDVLNLEWRMLSVTEINLDQTGQAIITMEDGSKVESDPTELYMIRIWRPHPRRAWEADSPTRASLPVLRELLGLTQHISAQVDSRLAGAGLLAVSSEADAALKRAAGIDENDPRSPLMEALTLAMQTAIKDRAAASALVPLAVTVPGNPSEAFHHLTFSTPLDAEARQLRDEAIRRLALGQDAPPELLLGSGGMNHWGAWLVREDVVTTHLEPPLSLICDALTTQYLRPLMRELGYPEDDLEKYVIWYDVDHLIARPNRTQDAKDLYALNEIGGRALREAVGFEEGDAPEEKEALDPAIEMAFQLVSDAPSLAQTPGLTVLVEQIRAMLKGSPEDAPTVSPIVETIETVGGSPGSTEGGPPNTENDPPPLGTPGNPGNGGPQ